MKTSSCAGVVLFGAMIFGGCAAAPVQTSHMRVHTTTAASVERVSVQGATQFAGSKQAKHKDGPAVTACKKGSSKSCNEVGDKLTSKHAYTEAREWYMTSCKRVSGAMEENATRLLELHGQLVQLANARDEGDPEPEVIVARQKTAMDLRAQASEIRARVQGCLDVGDTLKLDDEPRQSLKYFDTACEFSTLLETVGDTVAGLQHTAETGCAQGQSVRAEISDRSQFSPQLFADLSVPQPEAQPAPAAQADEGMVFGEEEVSLSAAPKKRR